MLARMSGARFSARFRQCAKIRGIGFSTERTKELKENEAWKAKYEERFGKEPLYRVDTLRPVAVSSDDHKWPRGSIYDNSTNSRFNLRTYEYFNRKIPLKLLDLGCAGGGLVRSFLADGHIGIGLEGSDHSFKQKSGEWGCNPPCFCTSLK